MQHAWTDFNTPRVDDQHHVLTRYVFNPPTMKSVGERIRQAREFRKMSGEELAQRVGYKTQSGISNLENRSTGMGGAKIVAIARALNLSLQWFLNGPDTADLNSVPPFAEPPAPPPPPGGPSDHRVSERTADYPTPWDTAHALVDAISHEGLEKVLDLLRMTAKEYPRHHDNGAGVSVPAPKKRAA